GEFAALYRKLFLVTPARRAGTYLSAPRFAERDVMECWPSSVYSGLILAAWITLPHFSVSSAISLPKSAGEPVSTVPPKSASRGLILGSVRAALVSWLSLSTMAAGVALGAPPPAAESGAGLLRRQ